MTCFEEKYDYEENNDVQIQESSSQDIPSVLNNTHMKTETLLHKEVYEFQYDDHSKLEHYVMEVTHLNPSIAKEMNDAHSLSSIIRLILPVSIQWEYFNEAYCIVVAI